LTAICQGRPCTINPEDCNVREPSIGDFTPSEHARAAIFIQWVRLCSIIGRVGQHLSRNVEQASFPKPLAEELIEWVRGLPGALSLPITSVRIRHFDRDVFKLHLPYLTTITILHMKWSSRHSSQPLPEAYITAVLASSCVARIFKEFLARGHIRFLGAISCWYVAVAIVALLHTQRIESLAENGAADIRILRLALEEVADLWPTAAIFVKGFKRLQVFEKLGAERANSLLNTQRPNLSETSASPTLADFNWLHGIDCQSYFPSVTTQTSKLAGTLLAEHQAELWGDTSWLSDPTVQLQNLFDPSNLFPDSYIEGLPSL